MLLLAEGGGEGHRGGNGFYLPRDSKRPYLAFDRGGGRRFKTIYPDLGRQAFVDKLPEELAQDAFLTPAKAQEPWTRRYEEALTTCLPHGRKGCDCNVGKRLRRTYMLMFDVCTHWSFVQKVVSRKRLRVVRAATTSEPRKHFTGVMLTEKAKRRLEARGLQRVGEGEGESAMVEDARIDVVDLLEEDEKGGWVGKEGVKEEANMQEDEKVCVLEKENGGGEGRRIEEEEREGGEEGESIIDLLSDSDAIYEEWEDDWEGWNGSIKRGRGLLDDGGGGVGGRGGRRVTMKMARRTSNEYYDEERAKLLKREEGEVTAVEQGGGGGGGGGEEDLDDLLDMGGTAELKGGGASPSSAASSTLPAEVKEEGGGRKEEGVKKPRRRKISEDGGSGGIEEEVVGKGDTNVEIQPSWGCKEMIRIDDSNEEEEVEEKDGVKDERKKRESVKGSDNVIAKCDKGGGGRRGEVGGGKTVKHEGVGEGEGGEGGEDSDLVLDMLDMLEELKDEDIISKKEAKDLRSRAVKKETLMVEAFWKAQACSSLFTGGQIFRKIALGL